MADSIGMMNPAYIISRNDVLTWINDTLQVRARNEARADEDRAVGDGCGVLPALRLDPHGRAADEQGELAGEARARVREQLQAAAERLRQEQPQEAHRGHEAGEVQVPGQPGVRAVVQGGLGHGRGPAKYRHR